MVFIIGASVAIGQEKIKFPVGVGTKTVGTNMFWLGVKKGFFDEVGLDVQPVLLRGTTITIQALASESLYLALGSTDFTIGTAAGIADLVAVSGVVNGAAGGLLQRPGSGRCRHRDQRQLTRSPLGCRPHLMSPIVANNRTGWWVAVG